MINIEKGDQVSKYYRIVVTNDMHCGDILGLTPDEWQCEEYRPFQKPGWDFYKDATEQIGHVDLHVSNGDILDGPGYKDTTHLLATDIKQQQKMAEKAMSMVSAKKKVIVRGTGFHSDGHKAYEDDVADAIGCNVYDEFRAEIYGRLFHFKHAVGRSDTANGAFTQMQKEQTNDILQAEFEEYPSADVMIRAHVHYCYEARTADSSRGIMRTVYTAPALQMRGPRQNSFTRRLRTWKYDYGLTLIEVCKETKEVFIRPILMPIKQYNKREYICLKS